MNTNQNTPKLTDKPQAEQTQKNIPSINNASNKSEAKVEDNENNLKEYDDKHEHKYKTPIGESELA